MGFAPSLDQPATETILLVEDEAAIRNMFATALRRAGYNVLAARNGDDALDAIRAHTTPIDLIVSDVVMPKLGGKELFELLRRGHPGLPILLMSGYPATSTGAADLVDLETRFLPKPFGPEVLLARVRQVLAEGQ